MVGIYKITNPKGRVYVGQSTNIERRKYSYSNPNPDRRAVGPKIYNSLMKYGFKNHEFTIIEECPVDKLYEREVYWKKIILDEKKGDLNQILFCNIHDIGSFGPLPQYIIDKITGQKRTDETKLKMRNAKLGKPSNFKGHKHTKKTKEKLSKIKSGKPSTRPKKPILQYNLEGDFIKRWDSLSSVKEGGMSVNSIHRCCEGKQKTSYNFIWKWDN